MKRRRLATVTLGLALATLPAFTPQSAGAQVPRSGGSLNSMQAEDLPQGFAIHETAAVQVVWPASPCFNNLVFFDSAKPVESLDTIVPELAERWSCSHRLGYFTHWPHVKGLVPHHNIFNFGRMQDVWVDR